MDEYSMSAEVWEWDGPSSWHFATVPDDLADLLRDFYGAAHKAFGTLAVSVTAGEVNWKTSLFWDSKRETYLLPVKAEVRRKAKIKGGDVVEFSLRPAV